MELTGIHFGKQDLTPDKVRKKAQPIKYLARMFPLTKSLMTYGAIIDADFAEEFDVTIQNQSSR